MKAAAWSFLLLCACTQTVSVPGIQGSTVAPTDTTASTSSAPVTPTDDQSTGLVDWLTRYGYLPPSDRSTGQLQAWTAVTHAVRAMQRFAGLEDTGVADEETLALMQAPRCSLPDEGEEPKPLANQLQEGQSLRRKRAVTTWTGRNINWRLRSYPTSSSLSRETIRSLVFYALRVWADPTPLEFHEVGGSEGADMQVDFLHGFHGDRYPFDGAGGAVGHAFFPSDPARAGGVHLDAEEEWAFRQPASEGTDLFTVLVHEFGHALGLSHSSARRSVMRPYYQSPVGDPLHYRLGPHDLEHITRLYGNRNHLMVTDVPRLAPEPQLRHRDRHGHRHRHRHSVDRCNTSFDAVANIRGETFFFKGLSMWRVSTGGLVSGRGASVRRLWGGLPPNLPPLQAVLERHLDHAIIFITESQFWLFNDLSLQEGYPRPLSALRKGRETEGKRGEEGEEEQGLMWDPEEGPMWGDIGKGEAGGEEEESETWTELIRGGVNGITTERDGSIYLFKGDSYWKFPYPASVPEVGYPRSLATDWLDCPHPSAPVLDDFSRSPSPPTGRQELREREKEERGREERGGQSGHGLDRDTDREGLQHWPCTCLNGAKVSSVSMTSFICALLLTLLSLITV
ncbi:matrix metalloproteinase-17-like [Oncorhynchus mykiss]|uniref:Matrix metallopeptidase 17b n=1 Tax=Oncorhynchus mykiss TaxID=8022 RepID=A0A8K9UD39_ONCMY|nr:matrix metalloproteinase-17-like [Oncorhynchus mykiss]